MIFYLNLFTLLKLAYYIFISNISILILCSFTQVYFNVFAFAVILLKFTLIDTYLNLFHFNLK